METGKTFQETFVLIAGMFGAKALSVVLINYVQFSVEPRGKVKVTAALMEMLYGQAVSVDLNSENLTIGEFSFPAGSFRSWP